MMSEAGSFDFSLCEGYATMPKEIAARGVEPYTPSVPCCLAQLDVSRPTLSVLLVGVVLGAPLPRAAFYFFVGIGADAALGW